MRMDADRDEDEIGEYSEYREYDDHDDYEPPEDLPGPDDPASYWRRRFIVLAGGVAVVGLCVWLFPGGRPGPAGPAGPSAAARASAAALAQGSALPSTAYGTAYPGPSASPSASPSARPSPSPSASHPAAARSARRHKVRTSAAATAAAGEPRCAPAGVVLSLFTSQPGYAPGAEPAFSVYAVSTSATACALTYGPGSVHVVVTRQGHVVWNSADCKPAAARKVRFTLGVPQVLTMSWNRQAGRPAGCAGSLPAGTGGTLEAVALTAGQSSPVRSFTLGR